MVKLISGVNDLATLSPKVSKEWHPTKNGSTTSSDVTLGLSKKFWWCCSKDSSHEWEATIADRTRKDRPRGCPYCSGRKLTPERSLALKFPEIAKEWHPIKNGSITPDDVSYGANKKIWWQCSKNQDHVWDAMVYSRIHGQGCPFCSGRRVTPARSLAFNFPEIAKEWHPTKNGSLTPVDVTLTSGRKIWWQCPKHKQHVYDALISSRTSRGHGCPYCSGQRVTNETSLAFNFPEIAKEWHPTKNGLLTPQDVTSNSGKIVWWQCFRFKDHVWKSPPNNRTRKDAPSGCPFCRTKSSVPEIRVLAELRGIFKNIFSQYKQDGRDIDIFLPDISIGIEYDGVRFHKTKAKIKSDLLKNSFYKKKGISIIRLREKGLSRLDSSDLLLSSTGITKEDINHLLKIIASKVQMKEEYLISNIETYIACNEFTQESLFKAYLANFPSPLPENSLTILFPEIAKQWHEKNAPLSPSDFSPGSSIKVWWQCPKYKQHVYDASVGQRTRGQGCPFCSSKRISPENSLAFKFPEIAKEWHHSLNGSETPLNIFPGSNKKFWWQCSKIKDHVWQTTPNDRTCKNGTGCPDCGAKARRLKSGSSLQEKFPEIAKEWHLSLNGLDTPDNFSFGSGKKVWWQCHLVKDHIWEAEIKTRSQGSKCPYCSGRKLTPERSLALKFPEIAKEWHPTKNGLITPNDVSYGANKKIWWQCSKNQDHVWETYVRCRSRGTGCPFCSGHKKL